MMMDRKNSSSNSSSSQRTAARTRFITLALRRKLCSLDTYMVDCNSDIDAFNAHVLDLVHTLEARGEDTQDLLFHLFHGYMACRDREFVKYIRDKQDLYHEGEDISPEQLMTWALRKFQRRNEDNLWCKT
jgi:hypothetical protein